MLFSLHIKRRGAEIHLLPFVCLLLWILLPTNKGSYAQRPWPLWESYTKRFVDDQGRVIDRSAFDRTTSEGEAYAMFFALVDNDRKRFEKFLTWTETNMAAGDLTLRLPSWNWGKTAAGEWKVLDENSASDADLWMAYSLMEAGRLWHEPRYDKLGRTMASRIAKQEVVLMPGLGTTMIPGTNGFHPDQNTWFLNPSYMPAPLLAFLAKAMPTGPWASVLRSLPTLVGGEMSHGFAMDWILADPGGQRPTPAPRALTSGVHESQASGSYDAIRVYLWLGIADPGTDGVKRMLGQVAAMGTSLHATVTPPLEVDAQGRVVSAAGPPGFSAAVVPYLLAAGLKAEAISQQDRLTATRDEETGLFGRGAEYYDQNLALFFAGWSERRFRFERDGRLKVQWK